MYVVCGRVIKFCDTLWVKLGFASLHSLYLLYTNFGRKANFDEVGDGEKISPSGIVEGCRGGEQQNEKLSSWYFVSRPRRLGGVFWAICPKHTPVYCAYCTKIHPALAW